MFYYSNIYGIRSIKTCVILSLLLTDSVLAVGQNNQPVLGKWKVISMADNEMYTNFKTDSVELFTNTDSSEDKEVKKEMLKLFLGLFGENIFVFGANNYFETLHNDKPDGIGKYTIDNKRGIITTTVKRNNVTVVEKMKFSFKSGLLNLICPHLDKEISLTCERVIAKE